MDATSELRRAYRTAALITGALITGPAMYAVIAQLLRNQASFEGVAKRSEAEMRLARYTAWLVSAGVVVGLPALRRVLLRRSLADTRRMAIARLTITTVAAGGLAESPAVAGFVFVLLGGALLDFHLLGRSLALLLANFPRYEAWEEWIAAPAPRP
ncbi:MAG: hypothetical protein ACREKG_12135 [Candidatus Rokuibacteriota bacterium]